MLRLVSVGLALIVVIAGGSPVPSVAAANDDPTWNTTNDGWSGSGSVATPDGSVVGPKPDRNQSSTRRSWCQDCHWAVFPVCDVTGPFNCFEAGLCPVGERRWVVFFARGDSQPRIVHAYCGGPDQQPMSLETFGSLVRQRVQQAAPELHLRHQPRPFTLTQLPTVFSTGQPASISRSDVLSGIPVQFEASGVWTWRWGDGSSSTVASAGENWPDGDVRHTYRRAGRFSVQVTARWDARFRIAGSDPIPVPGGPLTQTERTYLVVRQARAVLVIGQNG